MYKTSHEKNSHTHTVTIIRFGRRHTVPFATQFASLVIPPAGRNIFWVGTLDPSDRVNFRVKLLTGFNPEVRILRPKPPKYAWKAVQTRLLMMGDTLEIAGESRGKYETWDYLISA